MVTMGIFPFKKNLHGRTGNRTRDLVVSSQKLWPLDHEAGLVFEVVHAIPGARYLTISRLHVYERRSTEMQTFML
jgi:hypothetical protein